MKYIKINTTILLLTILALINSNATLQNISNKTNVRETQSYANETLDAQAYYEAALKGKLASTTTKKDAFLFSNLNLIRSKPAGSTWGGVYEDSNGEIWYIKRGQKPIYEFLGSKIMDLLIGPFGPEVQLIADKPDFTASKLLPGFVMQQDSYSINKPKVGDLELEIAMNIMSLGDRHAGNQGYIDLADKLQAARVDFDFSFEFDDFNLPNLNTTNVNDVKIASTHLASIPDEQILYVLGNAFNQLWEAGYNLCYEELKDLGNTLIERKNQNYGFHLNILLINATTQGLLENVKTLIEEGADPKAFESRALMMALRRGHADIVNYLLEIGVDLDEHSSSAFISAGEGGFIDIVKSLIEKGVDINANQATQALAAAAEGGHIDIIKFLIEKGADINANQATEIFIEIVKAGDIDLVNFLLQRGAAFHINKKGTNALLTAVRAGHSDIVELLLERGANINEDQRADTLLTAVKAGYSDIVKLLLAMQAFAGKASEALRTEALIIAAENGAIDIVKLLLKKGVDTKTSKLFIEQDILTIEEISEALKKAIAFEDFEAVQPMVQLLLDYSIPEPKFLLQAIRGACRTNNLKIPQFLLEQGFDPQKVERILEIPIAAGKMKLIKLLIQYGADPHKAVWPPKMLVNQQIAQFLLDYGYKISELDVKN